jgi:hypothetical protein
VIHLRTVEPLVSVSIGIDGISAVLVLFKVGEVLQVVVEVVTGFRGRIYVALGVLRVVPARAVSVQQMGSIQPVVVEVLLPIIDAINIGVSHFGVHRTACTNGAEGVVIDQPET